MRRWIVPVGLIVLVGVPVSLYAATRASRRAHEMSAEEIQALGDAVYPDEYLRARARGERHEEFFGTEREEFQGFRVDLDGDGRDEAVVLAETEWRRGPKGGQGGDAISLKVLRRTKKTWATWWTAPISYPSIGDLCDLRVLNMDRDRSPEIAIVWMHAVEVFDRQGGIWGHAISPEGEDADARDLDGDGTAEIVIGRSLESVQGRDEITERDGTWPDVHAYRGGAIVAAASAHLDFYRDLLAETESRLDDLAAGEGGSPTPVALLWAYYGEKAHRIRRVLAGKPAFEKVAY